MSLSRRFINLVRSNLNALLDRAAGAGDVRLDDLSDEELQAELERRRSRRKEEEDLRRAAEAAERAARERASARRTSGSKATGNRGSPPRSGSKATSERVARLYAVLETPVGADLETVKKNFRRLMRQHHPDVNAGSPERLRMANERSKILIQAFAELERHLLGR